MSFDIVSYAMGKQAGGGGGGGVTVEPLSVTENGVYTAPSNKAYSPVTVEVPSAPVVDESKPIRFYDYDGTLLYSYTLQELQALTELPALPEHTGLTAKGWNWTLADLKTENAPVIVGAHYGTTDGVHRFYIKIDEDSQRKIALIFTLDGTAEIDWGDNSAVESISGNDNLTATPTPRIHEYAQTGDYCIGIKVTSGIIRGAYSTGTLLQYAYRPSLLPNKNYSANSLLTRIEGGDDTTVDYCWFKAFEKAYSLRAIAIPSKNWYCPDNDRTTFLSESNNLPFVSIPSGVTCWNFYNSAGLERVSVPSGKTSLTSYDSFSKCFALKRLTLPKSITSIGVAMFSDAPNLRMDALHSGVTSIEANAFKNCYSLTAVKIPNSVTTIGNNAFANCTNVHLYDFTAWSSADIDACTFGTTIFSGILTGTQIMFKYKSVSVHAESVTNLSDYSAYFAFEEDDT